MTLCFWDGDTLESNTDGQKGCSGSFASSLKLLCISQMVPVFAAHISVVSSADYSPERGGTSCYKQKTDDQARRYLQHCCFGETRGYN